MSTSTGNKIVVSVSKGTQMKVQWADGTEFWFDADLNVVYVDGTRRLSRDELVRRTTVSRTSARCASTGCEVNA